MGKDLNLFTLPMDTKYKYREKCVISLRKQAILLTNCNE